VIRLLIAYAVTAAAFCALDFTWLSLMGPRLYKPEIGELLAGSVRGGAAIAFYVIYIGGLVFFAVRPALTGNSWHAAALNGAVLGLISYATYDLTNQATLRVWSTKVTVADLLWGIFASALAATVGFAVTARLARSV
jgi:uncharacterized membrane protein